MKYNHDKIIAPFNLEIEIKYNMIHKGKPIILISNGYPVSNFDGAFGKLVIKLCEKNHINWIQYLYAEKNKENGIDDLSLGSGFSSLSCVHNWVKRNYGEKVGLLASSFGGNISLEYALNSDEISFLLLFNPVIDYYIYRLKQLGEAGLKKWEEDQYLILNYSGDHLRSSYRFLEEAKQQNLPKRLGNIHIPVTVFQGMQDPILYPDNLQYCKALPLLHNLYVIASGSHDFNQRKALDEIEPHLAKVFESIES